MAIVYFIALCANFAFGWYCRGKWVALKNAKPGDSVW